MPFKRGSGIVCEVVKEKQSEVSVLAAMGRGQRKALESDQGRGKMVQRCRIRLRNLSREEPSGLYGFVTR